MKTVLWKDILEKNKGNAVDCLNLPKSVWSLESDGRRIVYTGNSSYKRIMDFEGDQWKCYEKEPDEISWCPVKIDKEGKTILHSYYALLNSSA